MARPTKNNAEYFSHDANMRNDLKVKALRRKFGHMGYAVWCYLLETLTGEDGFELDFGTIQQELLAADYDVSPDDLKAITDYCVDISLLQRSEDGQRLFSEAHKRRFDGLLTKRARDRERLERMKSKQKPETGHVSGAKMEFSEDYRADNSHSKVKERKEKESKVKNSIVYPYQDIIELWNSLCGNCLPKVQKLTDDRREKIRLRLNELTGEPTEYIEKATELFSRVNASDFLRGDSNSGWTATFDWLFSNSKNWVKVMEGNYDNERGSRAVSSDVAGVQLGVGEFIDPKTKRRSYGSGMADIPLSAPPRPSENHAWNASTQEWTLL